jgi:hypothetical protein
MGTKKMRQTRTLILASGVEVLVEGRQELKPPGYHKDKRTKGAGSVWNFHHQI